jgi:hypothetical protein
MSHQNNPENETAAQLLAQHQSGGLLLLLLKSKLDRGTPTLQLTATQQLRSGGSQMPTSLVATM